MPTTVVGFLSDLHGVLLPHKLLGRLKKNANALFVLYLAADTNTAEGEQRRGMFVM